MTDDSAKERILCAAEALFAESGFDATPTVTHGLPPFLRAL